jgi:predicted MPP superfamily phosphohydrolase
MISRRRFLTLTAATAGAGVMSAANALAVEPGFSLILKEWTVEHPDWPAAAPSLRIGILTDIHAVEPWMSAHRIGSIVDQLNAQKPDVIVLLGDYVNGLRPRYYTREMPVAEWVAPLQMLRAPLGVYAILGNHDWWSGQAPDIRRAFRKAGIALLENGALKVSRGRDHFWMAGLKDQLAEPSTAIWDLDATLRHITDRAPVILLAHEPDIFVRVPASVTLTLAGHTHGGQIYIPFVGRPAFFAENARYAKYAYGHIEKDGRQMIVSSGLGVSNIPIRFMVPPEIAIVTLRHSERNIKAPLIVKA